LADWIGRGAEGSRSNAVWGVPAVKHLWPFIVSGIADGAIYALAAVGLVLTFRISGVFNFAYGSVAAASAYLFYQLRTREHLPWPVAALLTLLVLGILGGLLLERIAYWLSEASTVLRVVATVGILAALSAFLTGFYGAATLIMKPFLPQRGFLIGGIKIPEGDIITFVIGVAGTATLYVFFKRARLGLAMQAVVDDAPLLSMQGTSPVVVRRVAWAIGSCLLSMSGMLLAPKLGVDVNQLTLLVITAFGAAAIGAFSNLPLTFLGGIALGIGENIMSDKLASVHSPAVQQMYVNLPFIVLVVALVVIPRRYLIERGVQRIRRMRPPPSFSPSTIRTTVLVGVTVAVIIPFVVGAKINQFTSGLAFMVIFASLALLVWTSGEISLAQMAFAAVGAGTFAHALHAGFPWLLALLAAGLIMLPVAAVVAIPAIRLSGIYLAILTFGFGLLVQRLFFSTFLMFGAQNVTVVTRPKLFGSALDTSSDKGYYFTTLAIALMCLGVVALTRRTRLGRLLRAYGDSPTALLAHGANTTVTGVSVFCISAFVSGIAGALLAGVTSSASGISYDFSISLAMIAVLATSTILTLGYRMPVVASIVAAFIYVVLKAYIASSFFVRYQGVLFGVLAIAVACGPGMGTVRFLRRGRAVERERDPKASPMASRFRPLPAEVGL
jgi:branched-subunit amino acid ABC-type transport system permease component